ncbi:MAG: NUDIX domain-containing protein [Erysipelotrichaceae bacterium]|nr:NUDIX domain-containing protein [Erysipelotrichaceae bacterium]
MPPVRMIHCMQCGAKLEEKYLASEEKNIPWCPVCNAYRFPVFNAGVSMIITNPKRDKVLLIRQYGGDEYILCAGYINRGEDAEDAAIREIREELGLEVQFLSFNRSHFYAPSNTLMFNFTAVVSDADAVPNEEIDSWSWMGIDEARSRIRRNSLAQAFLNGYLSGTWNFPQTPAKPYK